MEELCRFLFQYWWYMCDGRTKTANFADTYILPVLLVVCLGCLIALVFFT